MTEFGRLPQWKRQELKGRIERGKVADAATGCWNWRPGGAWQGYPTTKVNGRPTLVRRLAYWLWTGEDPGDMAVGCTCRNLRCVNPGHLSLVRKKGEVDAKAT